MTTPTADAGVFLTPAALLAHWQGHRRLSRRIIELFPEDQLFTFSIGGMRTFGELANEMLSMAAPTVTGIANNAWEALEHPKPASRADLLARWDADTATMDADWPRIPVSRFHEKMSAFGQWEGITYDLVMYVVDNEIHHRGQGYVYLRALGIEPPGFWERT